MGRPEDTQPSIPFSFDPAHDADEPGPGVPKNSPWGGWGGLFRRPRGPLTWQGDDSVPAGPGRRGPRDDLTVRPWAVETRMRRKLVHQPVGAAAPREARGWGGRFVVAESSPTLRPPRPGRSPLPPL